MLFIHYLEHVLYLVDHSTIRKETEISAYTDDIMVSSGDLESPREFESSIRRFLKEYDLIINDDKTKFMIISKRKC